ncbi:hypothetical protein [Leptolyngbya sp. Heron Island J]|uniref:hypothetical protein n=1 Tax=Leptolyngbya sp. Heron Island J TaxID=1385935 RepID=UPI001269809A|nr:hypothetical protein [Leptolyngbya sp. Heron Island J]
MALSSLKHGLTFQLGLSITIWRFRLTQRISDLGFGDIQPINISNKMLIMIVAIAPTVTPSSATARSQRLLDHMPALSRRHDASCDRATVHLIQHATTARDASPQPT